MSAGALKRYGSPQSVSRALRRLVDEGHLEALSRGLYLHLSRNPDLAFDRAWSNPGAELPARQRIAVTLSRPTFRDVSRLCRAYGVGQVRKVLDDLHRDGEVPERVAADWRHRLDNIEKGFRDAANRLFAGRDEAAVR